MGIACCDFCMKRLAEAWEQGFYAEYADGTETGITEPSNPYREQETP